MARPDVDPLRPPADKAPTPPTSSQRAAAKTHYTRALKLYRQKKLEAARKELEQALQLTPEPDLHYAIAKIDLELDQCAEAITELQKFLETPHGPNATKAATDQLDTCKAKLAPPPPPAPAPEPTPRPAPVVHARPRWYHDWLGDGLVGAGAVSGLVGLLCYRAAVSDLDVADASMTLPEHARHVDDAHRMRTYAIVAAGSGLAFVTAGIVRFVTHDRGGEVRGSVAVVPTDGGGMISISGSLP